MTKNLSLSILIFYLLLFLGLLRLILSLVIFVLLKITIHVSQRNMSVPPTCGNDKQPDLFQEVPGIPSVKTY